MAISLLLVCSSIHPTKSLKYGGCGLNSCEVQTALCLDTRATPPPFSYPIFSKGTAAMYYAGISETFENHYVDPFSLHWYSQMFFGEDTEFLDSPLWSLKYMHLPESAVPQYWKPNLEENRMSITARENMHKSLITLLSLCKYCNYLHLCQCRYVVMIGKGWHFNSFFGIVSLLASQFSKKQIHLKNWCVELN